MARSITLQSQWRGTGNVTVDVRGWHVSRYLYVNLECALLRWLSYGLSGMFAIVTSLTLNYLSSMKFLSKSVH